MSNTCDCDFCIIFSDTLRTILGDIIIVMENLERFRVQRTRVTEDIIRTRNNQAAVDATTGQVRVLDVQIVVLTKLFLISTGQSVAKFS